MHIDIMASAGNAENDAADVGNDAAETLVDADDEDEDVADVLFSLTFTLIPFKHQISLWLYKCMTIWKVYKNI